MKALGTEPRERTPTPMAATWARRAAEPARTEAGAAKGPLAVSPGPS